MPTEAILNYLSQNRQWEQLRFQVVFQCAPVLKGVKAANLITLPKGMWLHLFTILNGTDISCKILYSGSKNEVLILYREKWLNHLLKDGKVMDFIREYGYEDLGLPGIFKRLRVRYEAYARKRAEFPHELGVFLQYPVEDVRGFILNKGQNSLLSGYWKVYHHPERARRVFEIYDKARDAAVREYMQLQNIRRVIR